MSKFFKGLKKAKKAVDVAPREMPAIQEDYGRLVAQAGQAQYQIYVLNEDLKRLNSNLVAVNQEAAARQALDKATTQEEAKAPAEPVSGAV